MNDVGLSIGAGSSPALATLEAASPGRIIAMVLPEMESLYEGQSIEDSAGFALMTAIANFASNRGDILRADVAPAGTVTDTAFALAEADSAGFTVTVQDTAGNTQIFSTSLVSVEYKAAVVTTEANEAQIDINPLVPDSETIDLILSGGTLYDGTYLDLSIGAIRSHPFNFPGTARITHTVPAADLVAGDVLTADEGLWSSPTDAAIAFTYQWQRSGVDIPGATSAAYTLDSADEGQAITLLLTASDGSTTALVTTAAISVPGTATSTGTDTGGEAPVLLDSAAADAGAGATAIGLSLGASVENDEVYLLVVGVQNSKADRITDLALDGVSVFGTAITSADVSSAQAICVRHIVTAAQAAAGALSVIVTHDNAVHAGAGLWKANGWTSPAYLAVANSGTSTMSGSIPVKDGGHLIGLIGDTGRSQTPSWSGALTNAGSTFSPPGSGTIDFRSGAQGISATQTYAVDVTHSSNRAINQAMSLISLK